MIFISVNTPTKESGLGAGEASDLKYIESSARSITEFATGNTIIEKVLFLSKLQK